MKRTKHTQRVPTQDQLRQFRRAFEQRERDVELAHKRIGQTVDDRCRWLLDDFAERDPDTTMATAERAVLRDNLRALAEGLPADRDQMTVKLDDPPDAALHALWAQLVALTRAHTTYAPLPPLTDEGLWQRWKPASSRRVRLERRHGWPDFKTALFHRAADLLVACERLKECPECHRLFVARRRQERHPACARKARDARRPSRQPKKAR